MACIVLDFGMSGSHVANQLVVSACSIVAYLTGKLDSLFRVHTVSMLLETHQIDKALPALLAGWPTLSQVLPRQVVAQRSQVRAVKVAQLAVDPPALVYPPNMRSDLRLMPGAEVTGAAPMRLRHSCASMPGHSVHTASMLFEALQVDKGLPALLAGWPTLSKVLPLQVVAQRPQVGAVKFAQLAVDPPALVDPLNMRFDTRLESGSKIALLTLVRLLRSGADVPGHHVPLQQGITLSGVVELPLARHRGDVGFRTI